MTKMEHLSKILESSDSDPGETLFLVEGGSSLSYNMAVSVLSRKNKLSFEPKGNLWRKADGKVFKIRDIEGEPEKSEGPRSLRVVGFERCMTWKERVSYEGWVKGK
jgi:hypothetical protein